MLLFRNLMILSLMMAKIGMSWHSMKKRGVSFFLLLIIVCLPLIFACNEGIDKDLPKTDTNKYLNLTDRTVVFPKGTAVVDVYNTVAFISNNSEWYNVTDGTWKYIKAATDTDGFTTQTLETESFTKIRHTKKDNRGYLIYAVYLYEDDTIIKEIAFNWHGEWVIVDTTSSIRKIEGEISFTF